MKKRIVFLASLSLFLATETTYVLRAEQKGTDKKSPANPPKAIMPGAAKSASKSGALTHIRLSSPTPHSVEGERGSLKIINKSSGQLAHCFYMPFVKSGYPPSYFALHFIKGASGAPVSTSTFKAIRLHRGFGVIWAPQFSPDGRYILLKYGASTSFNGPYDILVFDSKDSSLHQITNFDLAYDIVSWSPDGNYIAFIKNGDALGQTTMIQGDEAVDVGPLQLMVCEWRTGKTFLVTTNNSLRGPFNWLAPHTLTYGMLDNPEKPKKTDRPNIYAFSVEQQKSQRLFQDGFRPTPSPRGKWLAFFGSEGTEAAAIPLTKDWNDYPANVALCVASRDGSNRIALDGEDTVYPSLLWLPDEQHLLALKQLEFGTNNRAQLQEWDIKTRKFRTIVELRAHDFKATPRTITDPSFRLLGLSKDGTKVFVVVSEYAGFDPLIPHGVLYLKKTTLQSIELTSGKVTPLLQTTGDSGLDWYEK